MTHAQPTHGEAAHRGDGGDPRNADLAGGLISAIDTPAHRAAQALFAPSIAPDDGPPGRLPLVWAARQRDRLARWRLGLPQRDYHRWTFAAAVTADEFGTARQRGRRRGRR